RRPGAGRRRAGGGVGWRAHPGGPGHNPSVTPRDNAETARPGRPFFWGSRWPSGAGEVPSVGRASSLGAEGGGARGRRARRGAVGGGGVAWRLHLTGRFVSSPELRAVSTQIRFCRGARSVTGIAGRAGGGATASARRRPGVAPPRPGSGAGGGRHRPEDAGP